MPVSVGDKLGPYEIFALVGKGDMGEVYRARFAFESGCRDQDRRIRWRRVSVAITGYYRESGRAMDRFLRQISRWHFDGLGATQQNAITSACAVIQDLSPS